MDDLEELKKLRATIRSYEDTLKHYEEIFRADGNIDDYEQKQLDKLNSGIALINKHIVAKIKMLNSEELAENIYNTGKEAADDLYYKDDDIINHSLIDNIPITSIKNGKVDNLNITVHSAYWTEKFVNWVMDDSDFSVESIMKEILRINEKDYKDPESLKYAIENYECSGSLISVKKGSGWFQLNGYTNANLGDAIKFTIHIETQGFIRLKSLEGIDVSKGIQTLGGVGGGAATAVMKYSGFGKLARALHNYMDGKDPWTGEKGSTSDLIVGGITDLLTMGLGGPQSAMTNVTLNLFQEALENIPPEKLEELGISVEEIRVGRDALDIILAIREKNGIVRATEIISNVIQEGYSVRDLNNSNNEEE